MQPRIETIAAKKLVGMHITTTFKENKTVAMWQAFMPRRKEITNNIDSTLISMQVYPVPDFETLTLDMQFEKWATVEVADFDSVPAGMDTFTLPGGLYAVFIYKGLPSAFADTFHYIFRTWLPASGYLQDDRPHFEILGEKYKRDSPDSEEEIWIPIRHK